MDPASITAISIGATAFVASMGACLAPLFRKQKNDATQHMLTNDQDTVTIQFHGKIEHKVNCCCFGYHSNRDPQLMINSHEVDNSSSGVRASNTANGYQNYSSTQPRNDASISGITNAATTASTPSANSATATQSTTAPDTTNTSTTSHSAPNTITASDTQLIGQIDMKALSTMQRDNRDTYSIGELTRGSDGSFAIKNLEASVSPAKGSNGSPKDTHIGKDFVQPIFIAASQILGSFVTEIASQVDRVAITGNTQENDSNAPDSNV